MKLNTFALSISITLSLLILGSCGGGSSSEPANSTAGNDPLTSDELPTIFEPPPAPGAPVTTMSFDGLWDASDEEQNITRYWHISSNNATWITYSLNPAANSENCFIETSIQFTKDGLNRVMLPATQPLPIATADGVINIAVADGVMSLTYQDVTSMTVTEEYSEVNNFVVQDLQLCN